MKKILCVSSLLVSFLSFSALSAQQVSQHEVEHFKLVKVGVITVAQTGGDVSSPTELGEKLSELADKKGGHYYRVIAAEERGPNFEAIADVYNSPDK